MCLHTTNQILHFSTPYAWLSTKLFFLFWNSRHLCREAPWRYLIRCLNPLNWLLSPQRSSSSTQSSFWIPYLRRHLAKTPHSGCVKPQSQYFWTALKAYNHTRGLEHTLTDKSRPSPSSSTQSTATITFSRCSSNPPVLSHTHSLSPLVTIVWYINSLILGSEDMRRKHNADCIKIMGKC